MICERCHGEGMVGSDPSGERTGKLVPCPDCGGCGVAHCCEGERPDCAAKAGGETESLDERD